MSLAQYHNKALVMTMIGPDTPIPIGAFDDITGVVSPKRATRETIIYGMERSIHSAAPLQIPEFKTMGCLVEPAFLRTLGTGLPVNFSIYAASGGPNPLPIPGTIVVNMGICILTSAGPVFPRAAADGGYEAWIKQELTGQPNEIEYLQDGVSLLKITPFGTFVNGIQVDPAAAAVAVLGAAIAFG